MGISVDGICCIAHISAGIGIVMACVQLTRHNSESATSAGHINNKFQLLHRTFACSHADRRTQTLSGCHRADGNDFWRCQRGRYAARSYQSDILGAGSKCVFRRARVGLAMMAIGGRAKPGRPCFFILFLVCLTCIAVIRGHIKFGRDPRRHTFMNTNSPLR